ncbi:MAG: hypothetical protein KKE50_00315, partial [Nanoarchaeota archaeon]|nr:hypothetical protein [Nanoarchaeota archaeon]
FSDGGVEIYDSNNKVINNHFSNSELIGSGDLWNTTIKENIFNQSGIWLVPRGIWGVPDIFYNGEFSIMNNKFFGTSKYYGNTIIVLWSVSNSEISHNYAKADNNASIFIDLRSISDSDYVERPCLNNSIFDNEIHGGIISDPNESLNIYCVNGIGNHYFDGAIGPTCLDSDSDGVNDYLDKCPNTTVNQIVYGCSCEQILAFKPGNNGGELKKGCSKGTIEVFTKGIGWAKNLFG